MRGLFDRAIREYRKIVDEDPLDVRIWMKIGDIQAKQNNEAEAIDTYTKVAEFYSEQGFYLKAVAVFKQILRIDSEQVEVNLRLAELYKQLGLLNDAMRQYEKVSNFYHGTGRMREALAALYQIVELDPQNVASRIKLAELYSRESMRNEAVEEFSRAADFLRAENRIEEFIKVAERLVYHQPDNMMLIKELAGIYLQRRDPRRSLQKLQMAFKVDPRDEETMEMLARAFHTLGQVPKTVSVLKELARIYAENGEDAQQEDVYQRVLELAPNDKEAKKQLERLQASSPPPIPEQQPEVYAGDAEPPPEHMIFEVEAEVPPAHLQQISAEDKLLESLEQPGPLPTVVNRQITREQERAQEKSWTRVQPQAEETKSARHEDSGAQIHKIIAEAEVYIKYGLQDKAIEHLNHVFLRNTENEDVRLKLKDIYVQRKQYGRAARELYILARHLVNADRRRAAEILNEALEMAPEYDKARALLNQLETVPPEHQVLEEISTETRMQQDTDVSAPVFDLDAEDIVEEITVPDPLDSQGRGAQPASLEDIEEDLEEAEFFLQQSLFSEARAILEELLQRFPNHPLLESKLAELEMADDDHQSKVQMSPQVTQDSPVGGLAEELAKEVHQARIEGAISMSGTVPVDVSVEDVFKEFKREEVETISEEDAETHYDLGIAYREMGLMDEAVNAFKVAKRSKGKRIACHMMMGLCQLDQGNHIEAISQFKKGLYVEGVTDSEAISLYYELGRSHEHLDDPREALYYYDKVAKQDPRFRDVTTRIAEIHQTGIGLPEE